MKFWMHLVVGLGVVGAAQAQTNPARIDLLPIANPPPAIMFDPSPLSGTMLGPLRGTETLPVARSVDPAAGAAGAAVAQAQAAVPEVGAEPAAAAAPLPAAPATQDPAFGATLPESPAQAAIDPEPAPPPPPPEPTSGSVTVIVEGVESSDGIVNVALCDKSLSREGCPYATSTTAVAGFVETTFPDVPPGTYAVVGYHDVNKNDEFDKMLGVPREPYALSNKAGDKMVPTFADAALKIKKGENTVIIRLQRLLGG